MLKTTILILMLLLTSACQTQTSIEPYSHPVAETAVKQWVYKDDPKGFDIWQDPRLSMEIQQGDCEDLALLVVYILLEDKVPAEEVEILFGTKHGSGHVVVKYNNLYYDTYGVSQKLGSFTLLKRDSGDVLYTYVNPDFIEYKNKTNSYKGV